MKPDGTVTAAFGTEPVPNEWDADLSIDEPKGTDVARIKLKFVNGFTDRFGRARYYFRWRGFAAIPLPGVPGTDDFMATYSTALAGIPDQPEVGSRTTLPGTIGALVVDYYNSDEWQHGLAEETRKTRHRIIERFRARHGDKQVALLAPESTLRKMLGEIATRSAKRHWFKAIRGLLRFAVPTMLCDGPTVGMTPIKLPKSKGHHGWTDDEIEHPGDSPLGHNSGLSSNSRWRRCRAGAARWCGSDRNT